MRYNQHGYSYIKMLKTVISLLGVLGSFSADRKDKRALSLRGVNMTYHTNAKILLC
jgi:hypothetical protein